MRWQVCEEREDEDERPSLTRLQDQCEDLQAQLSDLKQRSARFREPHSGGASPSSGPSKKQLEVSNERLRSLQRELKEVRSTLFETCAQTTSRSPSRKRKRESSPPSREGPHALFLMGLPGAGKSTVKRERMHPEDLDIEPDRFKSRHPKFSSCMGEETDEEVHRWSVRRAAEAFEDALAAPRKPSLVFDSSGSNAPWLGRRVRMAKNAGYKTELLWVDVPVEIALLRNRDRAIKGRWCPENVIMDKAHLMEGSFQELSREADTAERLQNWSKTGGELEAALEDLYFYPAPRTRPVSLRPGEEGYGEAPLGARSPSPSASSRRTIRIGPWKRNDEVTERKNARLAWMDSTYRGNREKFVLEEVLGGREVLVEPNKFPYHLPPGIEHWTIWRRQEMGHEELCEYIEGWLRAREPHNVIAWNYDDNRGRRTIDVWHVHIYFQGKDGQPPSFCKGSKSDRPQEVTKKGRSPCSV